MRNILSILSLFAATVLFLNCSPKTTGAVAASPPAEVYTDAQKIEGKAVWQANCDKCHKLYEPQSHNLPQWQKILPKMTKRAKLEDAQAMAVRAYIYSNARS